MFGISNTIAHFLSQSPRQLEFIPREIGIGLCNAIAQWHIELDAALVSVAQIGTEKTGSLTSVFRWRMLATPCLGNALHRIDDSGSAGNSSC